MFRMTVCYLKNNKLIVPDTRFQVKMNELIVPDTRFQEVIFSNLVVVWGSFSK